MSEQPKTMKSIKVPIRQSLDKAKKDLGIKFAAVEDEYRWEELQDIEKRRREILLRVEDPMHVILTRWDGTVMQILVTDKLFWFTMALYVGIRVLAHYDHLPPGVDEFPSDSITVLGGFLSFFLVFWVNQSHSRYFGLYGNSMGCKGHIFNSSMLAVTSLPYAQASRLIRYLNAAHAAGYVGLNTVYPSGNFFNQINRSMGLLTEQERARLDAIDLDKGGSCYREILVWCMNEVESSYRKGIVGNKVADRLRDQILQLHSQISALYNAQDLPIPFFYVHFICLLTTLYLPLFAITASVQAGTGENADSTAGVVRGLIVMLQAIFVIGLRVLGQKMSDPYGDDLIDLSVMHYVHFTWQMSNRILSSHFPEEANPAVENALKWKREPLGAAWEPPNTPWESREATFVGSDDNFEVKLKSAASAASAVSADSFDDMELRSSAHDARTILNPRSIESDISDSALFAKHRPRTIFNPAIRESDWSNVAL